MTRLHETLDTKLSIEDAFAFVSDFANAAAWDPGTISAHRIDGGPVGVGTRYLLQVRMGSRIAPMEYRITEHVPCALVVLEGRGSNVTARDEIGFTALPDSGTRVDYVADIRLGGLLGLLQPFAGGAFRKIGREAREGMQRTLDSLAIAARDEGDER